MQHQRKIGKGAHLLQHLQMDVRPALVIAVGIADADGQGIRLAQLQKPAHLLGAGDVFVLQCHLVFQPEQLAHLRLHRHRSLPGHGQHLIGEGDVLLHRQAGAVDHQAGEAQLQCLGTEGHTVAVVQMDGHRHIHLPGAPLGGMHEPVVAGVGPGARVMGQDHGAAQLLSRLAAGPDDIIVAALGVDGGNGIALPGGFAQLVQIVGQHGLLSPFQMTRRHGGRCPIAWAGPP